MRDTRSSIGGALCLSLIFASPLEARVVVDPKLDPELKAALESMIGAVTPVLTWPIATTDPELQRLMGTARKFFVEQDTIATLTLGDMKAIFDNMRRQPGDQYAQELTALGEARAMVQEVQRNGRVEFLITYDYRLLKGGVATFMAGLAHELVAHTTIPKDVATQLSPLEEERLAFQLQLKYMEALLADQRLRAQFRGPAAYILRELEQEVALARNILTYLERQINVQKTRPSPSPSPTHSPPSSPSPQGETLWRSTDSPPSSGKRLPVRKSTDGSITRQSASPSSSAKNNPDASLYSTYLGGSEHDRIYDIAVDAQGNVYVTGETSSPNFPTTPGAPDTTCGTDGQCNPVQHVGGFTSLNEDAFVTKFDSTGAVVYSTYLGGSHRDLASGIAVDTAGNVYVAGTTYSSDFPTTPNAFDRTCGTDGQCGPDTNPERDAPLPDIFVTKLDPAGRMVYSTYVGGSDIDHAYDIAVDQTGQVYLNGETWSKDYPVKNAFQATHAPGKWEDAIVTKLDPTGSSLIYSTYLGGSDGDLGYAVAVDDLGYAYVTGHTPSEDFPTTPNAYQRTFGDDPAPAGGFRSDVFVTKFNPTGTVIYSTYLGGNDVEWSENHTIAVDRTGAVYVAGATRSTNFPMTSGAVDRTCGTDGQCNRTDQRSFSDAFVAKLDPTGSKLLYGTYVGGSRDDGVRGIAIDELEHIYLTSWTSSADFPITSDAFDKTCGTDGQCDTWSDAFVTVLNPKQPQLVYSTYLGGNSGDEGRGIALDRERHIYVAGGTYSIDFPTNTTVQPSLGGLGDGFLVKLPPVVSEPPPRPDLTITQFFVEPPAQGEINGSRFTAVSGQPLHFTVTFLNQGNGDAAAHTLTVSVDDSVVSRMSIPPLAAGEMQTYVTPTVWVATTGSHRITAVIDADHQADETNEENNSRSAMLTVTVVSIRDLAMQQGFQTIAIQPQADFSTPPQTVEAFFSAIANVYGFTDAFKRYMEDTLFFRADNLTYGGSGSIPCNGYGQNRLVLVSCGAHWLAVHELDHAFWEWERAQQGPSIIEALIHAVYDVATGRTPVARPEIAQRAREALFDRHPTVFPPKADQTIYSWEEVKAKLSSIDDFHVRTAFWPFNVTRELPPELWRFWSGMLNAELPPATRHQIRLGDSTGQSPATGGAEPTIRFRTKIAGSSYQEMVFAGHPDDPLQLMQVGCDGGIVSRSTNGGRTWTSERLNDVTNYPNRAVTFTCDPKLVGLDDGTFLLTALYQTLVERGSALGGFLYRGRTVGRFEATDFQPANDPPDPDEIGGRIDHPVLAVSPDGLSVYIHGEKVHFGNRQHGQALYVSRDGGRTFVRRPSKIDSVISMTMGMDGTLYAAYAAEPPKSAPFVPTNQHDQLVRFRSVDPVAFDTFQIPGNRALDPRVLRVSTTSPRGFSPYFGLGPELIADVSPRSSHRGRLYVVWATPERVAADPVFTSYEMYGVNYDLFVSYSDDRGEHWSVPVRVNDDVGPGDQFFPSARLDANGTLHVAWLDHRNHQDQPFLEAYYAYSTDGIQFSKNLLVSDEPIAMGGGGRGLGDYLDMVMPYPDRVYIAYPCGRDATGLSPGGACLVELSNPITKLTPTSLPSQTLSTSTPVRKSIIPQRPASTDAEVFIAQAPVKLQTPVPTPTPTPTPNPPPMAEEVPSRGHLIQQHLQGKTLPELPMQPDGTLAISPEELLARLLRDNPGVFLGDRHGDFNIEEHLIAQMPLLARQGVKTLFVEMVYSADQAILDAYYQTGNLEPLITYLTDRWDLTQPGLGKKYAEVVQAARAAGIQTIGIDVDTRRIKQSLRLEISNPHWRWVIQEALKSQPGKYLVFGGTGHSANYLFNKGVDVLLGIPSVDFGTSTTMEVRKGDGKANDFQILLPKSPAQPASPLD
ncbi:MAG: SBBP repeat-containing protein [Candidatus Omnitrophica bacterium]|nr:SBBP repeat-containing protein [Candidatus Omnitrophota bacterium]